MDTEQIADQADRNDAALERLGELADELATVESSSSSYWVGSDADAFRAACASARSAFSHAQNTLGAHTQELRQQQMEQETASLPTLATSSENAGQAGNSDADEIPETNFPGQDPYYGEVDPDVAARWQELSDGDRKRVAREIIEQELEKYGIEGVTIDFFETEANGRITYSDEDGRHHISINAAELHDPRLLHTLAHEVRHAAQRNAVNATEPGPWDWLPFVDSKASEYERLERESGMAREQIESFRDDWNASERAPYFDRAVEVDARNAGAQFSDDLTLSQLNQYIEDAGVEE